jgi:hypothetical protein
MKTKITVALLMSKLSIAAKLNKARLVVENISTNVGTFNTPSPDLVIVSSAISDLDTAYQNAADGGKTLKKIMHDKENVLMKLMTDLGAYVEAVADGNEDIVHLAGLDVKKPPSINKPAFEVNRGNESGTIELSVKAVKGAVYTYEYSLSPTGPWTSGGKSNKAKFLMKGLAPLNKYWFRVITFVKNADNTSDVLSLVVV